MVPAGFCMHLSLLRIARVPLQVAGLHVALALGAPACGEIQQRPIDDGVTPRPPEDDDEDPPDVELTLVPSSLRLSPGESSEIEIIVDPPERRKVQLALLGDTGGAYLDRSEIWTHPSTGRARVTLTVPATSEYLLLRASVGRAFRELEIDVRNEVFGTLRVDVRYSGFRTIHQWSVAVLPGKTCTRTNLDTANYSDPFDAVPLPPQDGRPAFEPFDVINVPTQRWVAVLVRGDRLAFGCRDDIRIDVSREQSVRIALTDRPLQLDALDLPLALGWDPSAEMSSSFEVVVERMMAAFTSGAARDLDALLGEMQRLSETPDAFAHAATAEGWLTRWANAYPDTWLSTRLRAWLARSVQDLFVGDLVTGRLHGSDDVRGLGWLELWSFGGVTPRAIGVPPQFNVELAAETSDRLRLETRLLWRSSRLLASLADAHAIPPSGGTPGVPQTLAELLDCSTASGLLAGEDGMGFETCDVECLATLCRSALGQMWRNAGNAVPEISELSLSGSGVTEIDDRAVPIAVQGSWVGRARVLDEPGTPVQGPFRSFSSP